MSATIIRIAGSTPTRSRAVMHNGVLTTVAYSTLETDDMYEQTRSALEMIDATLAKAGTDKTRVLTAMIYITDQALKPAMNKAWDEWADPNAAPMRACVGTTLEEGDLVEIVITAAMP